jgi:hypothetical protein
MLFGNSLIYLLTKCRLRDLEFLYILRRSLCGSLGLLSQIKQIVSLSIRDLTQTKAIASEKVSSLLYKGIKFYLLGRGAAGGILIALAERFWVTRGREGAPSSILYTAITTLIIAIRRLYSFLTVVPSIVRIVSIRVIYYSVI